MLATVPYCIILHDRLFYDGCPLHGTTFVFLPIILRTPFPLLFDLRPCFRQAGDMSLYFIVHHSSSCTQGLQYKCLQCHPLSLCISLCDSWENGTGERGMV